MNISHVVLRYGGFGGGGGTVGEGNKIFDDSGGGIGELCVALVVHLTVLMAVGSSEVELRPFLTEILDLVVLMEKVVHVVMLEVGTGL
jgi:hypothetical protein